VGNYTLRAEKKQHDIWHHVDYARLNVLFGLRATIFLTPYLFMLEKIDISQNEQPGLYYVPEIS